ncbi:MAG: hypothetical protein Kilf2KO_29310 [Rhodospirillales bacterium]
MHGQAGLLARLHAEIADRWQYFDRLVYLGNLVGHGDDSLGVLDEVLAFRRRILAVPHALVEDVVVLRGRQEEMWQKLLQLQFAADPAGVLEWLLSHGVGATLEAYGGSVQEGRAEARHGAVSLTRWTQALRAVMQRHPGHSELFASLRRAAYSDDRGLLLVSCGLDPTRRLEHQTDSFWWGHPAFGAEVKHFDPFGLVVRGLAAPPPGLTVEDRLVTVDGGTASGGPLIAACFDTQGQLHDQVSIAQQAEA